MPPQFEGVCSLSHFVGGFYMDELDIFRIAVEVLFTFVLFVSFAFGYFCHWVISKFGG